MRTYGKYLQVGRILIPRPPVIMESGDRAFINQENSIYVFELIKYIWWNRELLDRVKAETKRQEDFDTIVDLLGNLSRIYAQEGADYNYLRDRLWEDVIWEKITLTTAREDSFALRVREWLRLSYLGTWEKMWKSSLYKIEVAENVIDNSNAQLLG